MQHEIKCNIYNKTPVSQYLSSFMNYQTKSDIHISGHITNSKYGFFKSFFDILNTTAPSQSWFYLTIVLIFAVTCLFARPLYLIDGIAFVIFKIFLGNSMWKNPMLHFQERIFSHDRVSYNIYNSVHLQSEIWFLYQYLLSQPIFCCWWTRKTIQQNHQVKFFFGVLIYLLLEAL